MEHYKEKALDYFSSARTEVLDLLPDYSERVLEVGCGSGQTLGLLKGKSLCSETVGIELFPQAADEAKCRVDRVYCLDVEKQELPSDIGQFDLILLLDVLEHLVDPWGFLAHLVNSKLGLEGKIVISLPNARHFSMTIPLLMGNLPYSERGILDKTHLRFFTRKTAEQMIEGAGLVIESTKATSLSLDLNSGRLNAATLGLFSGFLASQYIFKAGRRNPDHY